MDVVAIGLRSSSLYYGNVQLVDVVAIGTQSLITSLMALVSELYVVHLLTYVVKMSKS